MKKHQWSVPSEWTHMTSTHKWSEEHSEWAKQAKWSISSPWLVCKMMRSSIHQRLQSVLVSVSFFLGAFSAAEPNRVSHRGWQGEAHLQHQLWHSATLFRQSLWFEASLVLPLTSCHRRVPWLLFTWEENNYKTLQGLYTTRAKIGSVIYSYHVVYVQQNLICSEQVDV